MPDSVGVAPSTLVTAPARASAANGGFPEPWAGAPVQLIRATHDACGGTTLVRLPPEVPTRAVRVVVCGTCQESFEVQGVEEVGALAPQSRRARPKPTPKPKSRSLLEGRWSLLAVPVALAGVVGGLLLIQGGGGSTSTIVTTGPAVAAPAPAQNRRPPPPPSPRPTRPSCAARAIRSRSPPAGSAPRPRAAPPSRPGRPTGPATRHSGSSATRASATPPSSSDRSPGSACWPAAPTSSTACRGQPPQGTIVRLEADAPPGKPAYDVTLRIAGPYRYYLATTLKPNASAQGLNGVELINNSLTPTVGGGSKP